MDEGNRGGCVGGGAFGRGVCRGIVALRSAQGFGPQAFGEQHLPTDGAQTHVLEVGAGTSREIEWQRDRGDSKRRGVGKPADSGETAEGGLRIVCAAPDSKEDL